MTITGPDARSAAPGQAVAGAAMLVLERMGLTPADLLAAPAAKPAAPTFAGYIPVVSALVSGGCRKAYGSYWNRVTDQWGSRCIDEPTPSEIRQLVQRVRPRRGRERGDPWRPDPAGWVPLRVEVRRRCHCAGAGVHNVHDHVPGSVLCRDATRRHPRGAVAALHGRAPSWPLVLGALLGSKDHLRQRAHRRNPSNSLLGGYQGDPRYQLFPRSARHREW